MTIHSSGKKSRHKDYFLGPEIAGWGGGLPRKGVGVLKFVPSLESLSSLCFEGGKLGCPGNFAGMSRTPGGVQNVCAKNVYAHISFPNSLSGTSRFQQFPRVTSIGSLPPKNLRKSPAEPRRAPAEPSERPRGAL